MIDSLKRWLYLTFVQKYFIEDVRNAQERGYKYGVSDTNDHYTTYTREYWHVEPYDVIKVVDRLGMKVCLLGGDPISDNEVETMKGEVSYIKNSRIWPVLRETIKQQAIDKAVMNSVNYEQALSGKLMIHNLGIIDSILTLIDDMKLKEGVDNTAT